MINWTVGLSDRQKEILAVSLEEEKHIPIMKHKFENNGKIKELTGKRLFKNKLIRGRDSGYTHYIQTQDKLESLSAFNWNYITSTDI
jgi:hypothetical protein